jgi:RNA 3'-terminal phosphate cyclase
MTLKKIEWAKMPEKAQVAALDEFAVRIDELNGLAEEHLNPKDVASRLFELADDLLDAFYERDELTGERVAGPGTGMIQEAIEERLRLAAEEAVQEARSR